MTAIEVRFATGCGIDDGAQAEIEAVLRRIPVGSDSGKWPHSIHAVEVVGRLAGGRTGSDVFDLLIHDGGSATPERCVAKLRPSDEAAKEWQAFNQHLGNKQRALLLKILAVTDGALGGPTDRRDDREAVIYQHVSEFTAEPEATTLEDVVADAFRSGDADAAVLAIQRLMRRAGNVLYRDAKAAATRTQLRWLNPTLGPDLVVEIDDITPDGELWYQRPSWPDSVQKTFPRDVILAAGTPGETGDEPIVPGSLIWLDRTEIVQRGDRTIARAADVEVEIRVAAGAHTPPLVDLVGRTEVALHARVLSTRTQTWWQRVDTFLPDLVVDNDEALIDGVRIHHPFQQLGRLLVDSMQGFVASLIHGDLNPRNVLLVEEHLCLIDYAKMAADHPLLSDPAWLEVNLLRDVIAEHLSRPELVRLQRLLAVAGRLCDRTTEDPGLPAPLAAMVSGASPALDIAFRVLWALRAGARDAYPSGEGCGPWWHEYLGALTLAACRTLKWPDCEQTEHAIAAAVVVAGTAAELLDVTRPGGPFRNWSLADLRTLIAAFVHPPGSADESLLAAAMAAMERFFDDGKDPPELARSLATARDVLVKAKCGPVARGLMPRLRLGRVPFIRLSGHAGAPAESGRGPDVDVLSLLAKLPAAVLLGDAGSGKSTLLRELRYRLAARVAGEDGESELPTRMPILVRASEAARVLGLPGAGEPDAAGRAPADPGEVLWRLSGFADLVSLNSFAALLTVGAFQLLVDGVDEPSTQERADVARWLRVLRRRYPRAPIVVCHRSFGYQPEILGLPAVTLHQVSPEQTTWYIAEALRAKQLPHADDCVRTVVDGLLASADYRQLRELTRTPLFLWMIVEWYAAANRVPNTAGELFTEFTDWYLGERHHAEHGERPRAGHDITVKRAVLQVIAHELVEQGNITELPVDRVRELCAGTVPGGPTALEEVLDDIVDSEMLQREGDRVRFLHQLFQEYFAACALADADRDALAERVLAFFWREPIRMLVGSPKTSQELVDFVLERAIDTDPRYAAWLLRAVRHRPASACVTELFVARQAERLRSAATGPYGWHRAAGGLAEYATRAALDELADVAGAASTPELARVEAIDALLDAYRSAVVDADAALLAAVIGVLTDGAPVAVTLRALRAMAEARLAETTGLAWDLIHPALPWCVVNAAHRALVGVGAVLSAPIRGRYLQACERRLAEAEDELWATALAEQVDRLQDERMAILAVLADAGALETVLARRFAFGLADRPGWTDLLAAAARHERNAGNPLGRLVDTPAASETEWLRVFAEGEDLAACAVAHRMLADGAAPPEALLGMITPESSVPRLLVAAAVVGCLGPHDLGPAEDLVCGLIEALDADRPELLEPLAALVSALDTAGHAQRIVLAHMAASVLRERDVRPSMFWPWARVWCDTVLNGADLAWLLDQGEDGAAVVAEYMSSVDFLITASARPPELYFSPSARRRLHARRPASPDGPDACRFVLTASFAGMVELLPYVISVARSETNRTTLVEQANSGYGLLTVALASPAISAIGYLGRMSADNGRGDAFAAYRLLHDLDTTDLHPSLERARQVGLGFLGHWQTILERLTPDDPVHRDAAENIVAHWVPGPCTPLDQGPAEIAEWIDRRLSEQWDLDPWVRSVLERIKVGLESAVGHYVGGRL